MRVRLPWAAVLLVVAALQLAPAYRGPLPAPLLAAAVVVPLGLTWLATRAGLRPVVAGAVVLVLACAAALARLRGGFGDAVPTLLTTRRPAPATAALLTPALLLTVLTATVVTAAVLVPAAPGRSGRGLVAPVAGAALLYTAGQLLDAGAADPHGIAAAALVLIAALGWAVPAAVPGQRRRSAAASGIRPFTVLPALLAVGVGLAVATAVPATAAFDPRHAVNPPAAALSTPDPLALAATWRANPDVEIMHAQLHGTQRLRIATMAVFTGDSWRVDDRYRPLGLGPGADLPLGNARRAVSARVTMVRPTGPWLPTPGTGTTTASPPDVLIDVDDGSLAVPSTPSPGLRYTVTGSLSAPTLASLQGASVPPDVPGRYLALPGASAEFSGYARQLVRGASTPLEEAVAIEHAVLTGRDLAPTAPTGTSYARLATFLFAHDGPGAQRGTAEQFAAAFAVLARAVGLPARLVVGFGVPADGVVRGRDVQVWPEVYFAGAGWVPFAPTPGTASTSGDAGVRDAMLGQIAARANVVPLGSLHSGSPLPPVSRSGAAAKAVSGGGGPGPWLPVAAVLAVALAVVLALALLRALRSARHRRRGVAGAWAEVLDVLVLLRRPPGRDVPAPRLGTDLAVHIGGAAAFTAATHLAAAADRAAFAPPGDPPADTAQAWRQARLLRRQARARLPWPRRAAFPVDPRPLLRR